MQEPLVTPMQEPLVTPKRERLRNRRRFSLPCGLLLLGYPLGCLRGRSRCARCVNACVQLAVVLLHGIQITLGAQQYAASERSRGRIVTAKTSEGVAVASIVVTCAYSLLPGLLAQRVFVFEESQLRSRRRIHIPAMLALLHTGDDGRAPRCWNDAASNIFLTTVVVATAALVTLDFVSRRGPNRRLAWLMPQPSPRTHEPCNPGRAPTNRWCTTGPTTRSSLTSAPSRLRSSTRTRTCRTR